MKNRESENEADRMNVINNDLTADLIDHRREAERRTPAEIFKWRFVTNHLNLYQMLASGLIMSPKGFGAKYYRDSLADFPGFVPLFKKTVPGATVARAVSEKSHLHSIVATLNLKPLRGPVKAYDTEGNIREIRFPDELAETDLALLVPAPLPTSCIETIEFADAATRKLCVKDAADFRNVPLDRFTLTEAKTGKRKNKSPDLFWPPRHLTLPDRDATPDHAAAVGGVLGMMLMLGNLGELGSRTCRTVFESENDSISQNYASNDIILRHLPCWLGSAGEDDSGDVTTRLFFGAVREIARCRSASGASDPRSGVLKFLRDEIPRLEKQIADRMGKLIADLDDLTRLSSSTAGELLARHPKPFSRALILFFLRERGAELLELTHGELTEPDRLYAGILFGARDGWIDTAAGIRVMKGVEKSVVLRMAALEHRVRSSGIVFEDDGVMPRALFDTFVMERESWDAKRNEAARILALECGWSECITTRIHLGKGDYRLQVDATGVQLILQGEAKAVKTVVDREMFIKRLPTLNYDHLDAMRKAHDHLAG